MENVFIQISALLVITTVVAFFVRFLKQPLIIGYLVSGIICGPLILNIVHGGKEMYEAFAQFGVALLLFVIGLNLDLRHLKEIGRASFVTGVGQVLFTMVFGFAILLFLGFSIWPAVFLASAITFSSTIIIMKLLAEKKDTETVYGRHTIGLMIVQDIIAVLMIAAIGLVSAGADGGFSFSFLLLFIKTVVLSAVIFLLSRYFLPFVLRSVSGSGEMLFLFTVAWCFGVSAIFYLTDFSIEIGAVVAGICLASSPFKLEIGARVRALRDFFLVLFFIVLGAQIGLGPFSGIFVPAVALSLFILIGNPLILYFIFRLLKFTRKNSFLAGLTAAQVSEFGFVLLFAGAKMGFVAGRELSIFTAVALITIFISSYLILNNNKIYRLLSFWFKIFGPDKRAQTEKITKKFDAWVFGYHRIGSRIAERLSESGFGVAVADYDPAVAKRITNKKIHFFFGDGADLEFLSNLPLSSSKIIISTIPSLEDQLILIDYIKRFESDIFVVANASHRREVEKLYAAGADYVMMPHFVGGDWVSDMLKKGEWNKDFFRKLKEKQVLG